MSAEICNRWKIVVVYVEKKTGHKRTISAIIKGTIDDAKRKSKTAFKSTKTARIASIKVIPYE